MIATATRLVEGVLRPDDRVGRAIVEAVLVQLLGRAAGGTKDSSRFMAGDPFAHVVG